MPEDNGMELVVSVARLLEVLQKTECVYIHDRSEKAVAMVIPLPGWWAEQLPEAPEDHFGHGHVQVDPAGWWNKVGL